MPRGVYSIKCNKKYKITDDFEPADHQKFVTKYFEKSDNKGILLFHQLGSGKTCTSAMIADRFLKKDIVKHVYILSPGTLIDNFVEQYCTLCGKTPKDLAKNFTFITYNYSELLKYNKDLSFEDSLVIIDEAQKFVNAVKNVDNNNAPKLYKKILNSNCRVVALSGTPIIQYTWEFAILGNMLKPGVFPNIIERGIFTPDKFREKDITDEKLSGIISYFGGDPQYYPTRIDKPIIKIEMSDDQYNLYKKTFENEIKAIMSGFPEKILLKKDPVKYKEDYARYILAVKYFRSRLVSNCFYNGIDKISVEDNSDDTDNVICEICEENENLTRMPCCNGVICRYDIKNWFEIGKYKTCPICQEEISKYDLQNLKDIKLQILVPDKFTKEGGWIDKKIPNLSIISPKFYTILKNIILHPKSKHVIYTSFIKKGGINLLYHILVRCGISVKVFSGMESDKERSRILNKFNDKNNRYGEKLTILLLSEAGAEGINILECKNIHIVESSIRENTTRQAIARVIRYKSHYDMPKDEQYVNVWRYWSVNPDDTKPCIDEILYKKGETVKDVNQTFTSKLILNSIEKKE
jgi:superfamily II DNA or RNA helicase